MVTIHMDNVSFELRKTQSFLWLKEIGNVFCVFDRQDSDSKKSRAKLSPKAEHPSYEEADSISPSMRNTPCQTIFLNNLQRCTILLKKTAREVKNFLTSWAVAIVEE